MYILTRTKYPDFSNSSHTGVKSQGMWSHSSKDRTQRCPPRKTAVWSNHWLICPLYRTQTIQFCPPATMMLQRMLETSPVKQGRNINNINMGTNTTCTAKLRAAKRDSAGRYWGEEGGRSQESWLQQTETDIINMILKIKAEQSVRVFGLDQSEQPEVQSQMESKRKQLRTWGNWKSISELWTQRSLQMFTGTEMQRISKLCHIMKIFNPQAQFWGALSNLTGKQNVCSSVFLPQGHCLSIF